MFILRFKCLCSVSRAGGALHEGRKSLWGKEISKEEEKRELKCTCLVQGQLSQMLEEDKKYLPLSSILGSMNLSLSPKAKELQVKNKRNLKAAACLQNHPGTPGAQGIGGTGAGTSRAGSVGRSTNDSSSAVSDNGTLGSKSSFSPLHISSLYPGHPQPGLQWQQRRDTTAEQQQGCRQSLPR